VAPPPDRGSTRRRFLLGTAAGAGWMMSGCGGEGQGAVDAGVEPIDADPTAIDADPGPIDAGLPATATWMYFKGNGHETGRNGPYDHVAVQRYFSIPTVEGGTDTLPWAAGFSLCWQLIPVRQAGYYTTFFYAASQGTDFFDLRDRNGYVGCHPYPYSAFGSGGDDFRLHKWEVSVDAGDFVGVATAYGQVHTQAFRLGPTGGDRRSALSFYPRVTGGEPGAQTSIDYTHAGGYAGAPPHPFKAVVFGDAPWWRAHQHERLSGFVRRIKIFAGAMAAADLLAESQSDALATAAGAAQIWWGKISPQTPDDLTSDFVAAGGRRRVGAWIDGARCQIVAQADLASHHALLGAAAIGNLQHMERG
jgi:hypothetical protein